MCFHRRCRHPANTLSVLVIVISVALSPQMLVAATYNVASDGIWFDCDNSDIRIPSNVSHHNDSAAEVTIARTLSKLAGWRHLRWKNMIYFSSSSIQQTGNWATVRYCV